MPVRSGQQLHRQARLRAVGHFLRVLVAHRLAGDGARHGRFDFGVGDLAQHFAQVMAVYVVFGQVNPAAKGVVMVAEDALRIVVGNHDRKNIIAVAQAPRGVLESGFQMLPRFGLAGKAILRHGEFRAAVDGG